MSRYVHNYGAFDRLVLNSPKLHELLDARGERVAETFRATAPVGEPYEGDDHAGRFRDSVSVHTESADFGHGRRVNTRVSVDDPQGLSIEFGHHVKRDVRGRFTHRDGEGVGEPEFIEGSHTLSNAVEAARD